MHRILSQNVRNLAAVHFLTCNILQIMLQMIMIMDTIIHMTIHTIIINHPDHHVDTCPSKKLND